MDNNQTDNFVQPSESRSYGYQTRVNDDNTIIRIRLDASDIVERIEVYLRGYSRWAGRGDHGGSRVANGYARQLCHKAGIFEH